MSTALNLDLNHAGMVACGGGNGIALPTHLEMLSRPLEPIVYANFKETKEHWVLSIDLPGVEPQDIEVSFNQQQLFIKAHRNEDREIEEYEPNSPIPLHVLEKSKVNISRQIQLPHNIDLTTVKNSFNHGDFVSFYFPFHPFSFSFLFMFIAFAFAYSYPLQISIVIHDTKEF